MQCQSCSFENHSGSRFCQSCGQPLQHSCPNCGTFNDPTAHFCRSCGNSLNVNTVQEPVSKAPGKTTSATRPADLLHSTSRLEGERKPVTILFTDIVGSTSTAEKLDPEEWKAVVSGAHRIVSQAVRRYDGTIAQFLGDGVLAFFGAPLTHEDDPQRAAHAALEIQHELVAYRPQLRGMVDDFQMRIGLHSGLVVVGEVGDDQHLEYLAVGDSVNLAARLQSAAAPGRVLVSASTVRLLGKSFELKDLGRIFVKGKAEPQHVYEILRPAERPASRRGISGLVSPLVGREAEYQSLSAALHRLEQGIGGIFFILGEAGVGKSRLTEEARLGSSPELRWLEGRSLAYGQAIPYWAINQMLLADLGLSDGDPELRIYVTLKRRLDELFGDRAAEILPYLSHLLRLNQESLESQNLAALGAETLKHQILQSIAAYFSSLATIQPLVLVFEDLHWADASTLEALERLQIACGRQPLLFLCLARLDRSHGSWKLMQEAALDCADRFTEIQLAQLNPEQSNHLVYGLLDATRLPEELARQVVDRADGNPLYIEEILRSLIDRGALVETDQGWQATAISRETGIPDTLQGVLLARIDNLSDELRQTLQMASVIGRSFLYRILEAISSAHADLDWHLAQLQRLDLVHEKSRLPELEYIFKHSLTQEAAYESILIEHRRLFHRKVGEALEVLFPERRSELLGLLAHHFDLAGEKSKAISYLLQAGAQSRFADSLSESIRSFRRAAELLEDHGESQRASQAWLELGLLFQNNNDFDAAYQAFEQAFRLKQTSSLNLIDLSFPQAKPQHTFRIGQMGTASNTLDPGRIVYADEANIANKLFAGLVEIDPLGNLVPNVARSWQVFDGGIRYQFHLRDDVRWTDGALVTAHDFAWTWKRNLSLDSQSAVSFDMILGARNYRLGNDPDPDKVGISALDDLTLELRLEFPTSFFLYILSNPIALPLPRKVVEKFGQEWWHPEHIVSNGPFRLIEYNVATSNTIERNPAYFGDFPGNLDRVETTIFSESLEIQEGLHSGKLDFAVDVNRNVLPELSDLVYHPPFIFSTRYIFIVPVPPLDDVRIRRALAHSLDRQSMLPPGVQAASGGLIPLGMAGHSPGLTLPYDPELARRLLAEAGFPGGKGFPTLYGWSVLPLVQGTAVLEHWRETLGIKIEIDRLPPGIRVIDQIQESSAEPRSIISGGWFADYPDPHNFLHDSSGPLQLGEMGLLDPTYHSLVDQAGSISERNRRMSLYRQADRILVSEQVFCIPIVYDLGLILYLQSWVQDFHWSPLNNIDYRLITLQPH